MNNDKLPLKELSIEELYNGANKAIYEVPVYQRNYAWGKEEISALVQDVFDAFKKQKSSYYIGTLVTFYRGDNVYEVIDGQQRLTTIRLVLAALGISVNNKLTYRARKKADNTLGSLPRLDQDDADTDIVNGYRYALSAIKEIIAESEAAEYKNYFLHNVRIIHYQVPKDIDLNHYFEIMNSRGEQLEKHEIIKARLLSHLSPKDGAVFSDIWDSCSQMGVYVQQAFPKKECAFSSDLSALAVSDFSVLANKYPNVEGTRSGAATADGSAKENTRTILSFLNDRSDSGCGDTERERSDTFQPIIDFPNFLLIVLKITRILEDSDFSPSDFNLDDKELIKEFDWLKSDEETIKKFGYNLLKAKYYLDNFIVHHSNENDTIDSNPWALQLLQRDRNNRIYPVNLFEDVDLQRKTVHLLSMFEVSFTARQRKNYLFYCLLYLFNPINTTELHPTRKPSSRPLKRYSEFIAALTEKYFFDVYLDKEQLNEINVPLPRSFDDKILIDNQLNVNVDEGKRKKATGIPTFTAIYGDGETKSAGIPLFVFNYLDYKLWEKYADKMQGTDSKRGSAERQRFFEEIGCGDFDLDVFKKFYFSRTRRSLEHYYPQATATGENERLNENQINCLGNYAMIGSEVNSSGSNNSPKVKLDHYLDTTSGKINLISVASLKFMIMMQKCKDNAIIGERKGGEEWIFADIQEHQKKMMSILFK